MDDHFTDCLLSSRVLLRSYFQWYATSQQDVVLWEVKRSRSLHKMETCVHVLFRSASFVQYAPARNGL